MSRKSTSRKLPVRLHEKHGAFYYVFRNKWEYLSRDYGEALRLYAGRVAPACGLMPDLLDRYLSKAKLAPKTLKTYTVCVSKLKVAFAAFRPDELKPKHYYAWATAKNITPSMGSHYRSVLVKAMDLAIKEGTVEQNLMREIETYTAPAREKLITDAEYLAIQEKASPTMKAIMEVAYLTGQRIMDVAAIKYSDLTQEGIAFKQAKTKTPLVIAWNPDLKQAVDQAKALHQSVKGLTLFHTRHGTMFSYSTIRTWWDRAKSQTWVEDCHMHDLRAKGGTEAKEQGLDSKAFLGHTSESSHRRYLRSKEVPVVQGVRHFRHKQSGSK